MRRTSQFGGPEKDGLTFVYLDQPLYQDVRITVRVTAMDVVQTVRAGVMIRSDVTDLGGLGLMGAGGFSPARYDPEYCSSAPPGFGMIEAASRANVNPPYQLPSDVHYSYGGSGERLSPPFYLKLERIGNDFATFRSTDGINWITLGGGIARQAGNERVGFYVSSGNQQLKSASFDSIKVELGSQAKPVWATTWIGSSAAQLSTDFISTWTSAFYVSPTGTSYKVSFDSETGHELNIFASNGYLLRPKTYDVYGFYKGGIAGDVVGGAQRIYLATRPTTDVCNPQTRIQILDQDTNYTQADVAFNGPLGIVAGMTARNGKVYVSEMPAYFGACRSGAWAPPGQPRVRVADTATGAELPSIGGGVITHPGALAADASGNVWVVDSATDYPNVQGCPNCWESLPYPQNYVRKYEATIRLLSPSGATIKSIVAADVSEGALQFSPVGLSMYTAPNGHSMLLVADDGPQQNIFVCDVTTAVSCTPWGMSGGVFGGSSPGSLTSPTGSPPRFFSPLAAYGDSSGNLWVASGEGYVDIKKYDASKTLQWARYGLGPVPGGWDPKTDGSDFYTVNRHHAFNTSNTTPGSEWSPVSVTSNPFLSTFRHGGLANTFAVHPRRLSLDPYAALATKNLYTFHIHGNPEDVYAYRNNAAGELATAFASVRWVSPTVGSPFFDQKCHDLLPTAPSCVRLWVDAAPTGAPGNGVEEAAEVTVVPGAAYGGFSPSIDQAGSIWLGWNAEIWELRPGWTQGPFYPSYSLTSGKIIYSGGGLNEMANPKDYLFPLFDSQNNAMYVTGVYAGARTDPGCPGPWWCSYPSQRIGRYDGFQPIGTRASVTPPASRYVVEVPPPTATTTDDYRMRIWDPVCSAQNDEYLGLALAGETYFVEELQGQVRAIDTHTGQQTMHLFAGPEVDTYQYNSDFHQTLEAFQRSNGEYLLSLHDSVNEARTLVFRWTPTSNPALDGWTPATLNPSVWFDASNGVQTNGGLVTSWSDASMKGHTLTNTSSTSGPTYSATGWNGKPTVSFTATGVPGYLKTSWSGLPAGDGKPFTVLAMVQPSGRQTASFAGFSNSQSTVHEGIQVGEKLALTTVCSPDMSRTDAGGNVETYAVNNLDLNPSVPQMMAFRFSPAVNFGHLTHPRRFQTSFDYSNKRYNLTTDIGNINPDTFLVGSGDTSGTGRFTGNISEIVVVPRELTDAEVEQFKLYAYKKWGGIGWTPALLNPSAWYDATDVSPTSMGYVPLWPDHSLNERDLQNTNARSQPSALNDWNSNRQVVSFGAGTFLRRDGWIGAPGGNDSEFSVLAVFRATTSVQASIAGWWNSQMTTQQAQVGLDGSAGLLPTLSRQSGSSVQSYVFQGAGIGTTQPHVVAWRFKKNPDTLSIRVDATQSPPVAAQPAVLSSITPELFLLGKASLSATGASVDLAELVIVPRYLSDTEVTNYRTYARSKWPVLP